MKDTENLIPFLKLNEGDNIYDIYSFGICGDYPTVIIDKSVYKLPKEYMEICKLFLLMPPHLPIKVNFIKEGKEYSIKFMED